MESLHVNADLTRLENKTALVTGGASGIGLAIAQSWAAAKAYVTIVDIRPTEEGQRLAAEIANATGGHVNYVAGDVTDWDSMVGAFRAAIAFSPVHNLDLVATCAGIAAMPGNQVDHVLAAGQPTLESTPPRPNTSNFDVNLKGVYYTSWLALYYFGLEPKAGTNGHAGSANGQHSRTDKSLIFVSSIGGYMDSPKASTYPASKFGVRGLFRSTRARTLDIGVRCNLLAPWFVDTPLIAPVKKAMATRGIDMAKVLSFASIEACVEAANVCAAGDIHGRALAVQPEGIYDLKDDVEDGWAGDQLRPIMKKRREAGFDA